MSKGSHPRPFTDRKQFENNWKLINWKSNISAPSHEGEKVTITYDPQIFDEIDSPKTPAKKEYKVKLKITKIEKGKPSR